MTLRRIALPQFLLVLCLIAVVPFSFGQTETATFSGLITDPQGKVVPGVAVEVTNIDTNVTVQQTTNGAGLYVVVGLKPGRYRVSVSKESFRRIDLTDLVLNVQDVLSRNFQLQLGPVMASITVVADEAKINTESATVSTVVDRQFADNLPMNGRSFQTLIDLTPGVVLTVTNPADSGQFSINGQRASSNYWTVDGVSANIGTSSRFQYGGGFGGTVGSFSVLGGTNGLVSVDALQEFRIQTSTYAPEFGRTPGGQISIVTRSGTNQFHGAAFDYLRNDALDANNWFNTAVTPALPKAKERQNDFGATFTGPIIKGRTFFFFSYEGLRLRLPSTSFTTVPDTLARQNAPAALQPYLNAFPLPNGPADASTGTAQFNASYSNPASLDAYSLRIDHRLTHKLNLFGRYNYSPSQALQRGSSGSLNTLNPERITTQTSTLGATWFLSSEVTNDLRFNYSRVNASGNFYLDTFGGGVPLDPLPFPSPFTSQSAQFDFAIFSLTGGPVIGRGHENIQRQFNVIDSLSLQKGTHALKVGIDFRRLSPTETQAGYLQEGAFLDVQSAVADNPYFVYLQSTRSAALLFRNLGVFGQDSWRVTPRLTMTYGVRWDIDFAPSTSRSPTLPALTGYKLSDLTTLAVAPSGTPVFKTPYGSVAPRLGVAYQIRQNQDWQSVLRGGVGIFYDLASPEVADIYLAGTYYPFGAQNFIPGPILGGTATFPLSSLADAPPPIVVPGPGEGTLLGFDPNLKLPYTAEWNIALEQGLGRQQTISAAYIGSAGRRLLQSASISSPNPSYAAANVVGNLTTSDYDALQIQFNRRLSQALQALVSYTWSHSIDAGSAGSFYNRANDVVPSINPNVNRGPSDFDIRNAFSAALTYDIPTPKANTFARAILRGWSLQSLALVRSAPPINVYDSVVGASFQSLFGASTLVRPDVKSGVPLYLYGSKYPGDKALNPGAFSPPPTDPTTNRPTRQGNLGRNALRGFGATQWDLGVHRDFPLHESLKLQFRAEMFNVLNHPNFAQPSGDISNARFGVSTQMLGQSLGGATVGGGGLSSLYQVGGPRSIQLALKILF